MFSTEMITPFIESFFSKASVMDSYKERIAAARKAIAAADYVLIGAGAGLSAAAGLDYGGMRFKRKFSEFIERYGFTDLYTSSFYDFPTEEERWAYWAKHIDFARFAPPAMELYRDIFRLVDGKEYFVITTNVDGQFRKAGFASDRLFEMQGDYAYLQCACGCHSKRYNDEKLVKQMLGSIHDGRIPSSLVPHCPVCGGSMDVNLRKNSYFVEDSAWHLQADRYTQFLKKAYCRRCVLLELGVGYNTPGIIRFPFEQMTSANSGMTLIRLNRDFPERQMKGKGQFVGMDENVIKIIQDLNTLHD
ncbi:SIR2 family NAD-dependent protein deacylase [Phocaeicola dorei]|jgi:NAD-dependent SIR2 family protein deacetylase|uniref:SIR2 family NAD-dependent protein deacylase n=2 Tax=Bacteroidia TaxID=200643 RepID=UPI001C99101A|nr:Sir2 silent information regulator family NAD-dependent deacetylase [Phocaeicola dorei]